MDLPLQILLDLMNLARSVFFYHLKEKMDKDSVISQKIMWIYCDNHEFLWLSQYSLRAKKIQHQ